MSEGGDIFTPVHERDLLREAELLALRQMSASLSAMTTEMVAHRTMISEVQRDVAVIKERQLQHAELKVSLEKVVNRLDNLEDRNTKQDGAVSLVQFLKDFGPWLISLVLLAWSFLARRPL